MYLGILLEIALPYVLASVNSDIKDFNSNSDLGTSDLIMGFVIAAIYYCALIAVIFLAAYKHKNIARILLVIFALFKIGAFLLGSIYLLSSFNTAILPYLMLGLAPNLLFLVGVIFLFAPSSRKWFSQG